MVDTRVSVVSVGVDYDSHTVGMAAYDVYYVSDSS